MCFFFSLATRTLYRNYSFPLRSSSKSRYFCEWWNTKVSLSAWLNTSWQVQVPNWGSLGEETETTSLKYFCVKASLFLLGYQKFATVIKSGPNFLSGSIGPSNPACLTDRLRGGGLLLDRNWDQQTLGTPSGCYIPSIPLNTFNILKCEI